MSDIRTFFAPGRTELAGNHTDHQKGRVLCAAVDLGITARVRKSDDGLVRVRTEGFRPIEIDIFDLEPRHKERGASAALVRGVLCALDEIGAELGGFQADISSTLRSGGGLSSSAAFSVLMGRIINGLYNGGNITPEEIAKAAQEAENCHFGKPCGLMDDLACSMGGKVYIDFLTGVTESIDRSFSDMGLAICLLDTGGSHGGLTADYAQIPMDMAYIASLLGVSYLGEAEAKDFFALPADEAHRRQFDRAAHFFTENERVPMMRQALLDGDGKRYMELMNQSGRSSERLLRNIRSDKGDDALERGLALSASILEGCGAWRVHGGGFAGCVQALMPAEELESYRKKTEAVFGPGSCMELKI